jgi:hypothetical protein
MTPIGALHELTPLTSAVCELLGMSCAQYQQVATQRFTWLRMALCVGLFVFARYCNGIVSTCCISMGV